MKPLIIAHRGYKSQYPENTMLAFEKALEAGADGIELDLQLTKDEEILIFHDDTYEAFFGDKRKISEVNLEEAKKFTYKGEKLPTLGEVITTLQGKFLLDLELKEQYSSEKNYRLVEKTLQTIGKLNYEKTCFSSFSEEILSFVKEKDPKAKLGLLFEPNESEKFQKAIKSSSYSFLIPHFSLVNSNLSDVSKQVWCYTVREKSIAEDLIRKQISGMILDDPNLLKL